MKCVIKDLFRKPEAFYGKEVTISGWIRTVRDSKTFGFLEMNDGSFLKNVQVVFDDKLKNFEKICKLTIEEHDGEYEGSALDDAISELEQKVRLFKSRFPDIFILSKK